ncbi:PREDICTED: acetylajmalan esterase-like [Ipomoea nil]|uniref:acetylajmalan esterase-like n=1 Tax=Ipomoea nil TaxID=35883 RepID=UPI000900C6AE|nr:PREDICTED: acetylajmalan esterase-like [Ipomoea nil]
MAMEMASSVLLTAFFLFPIAFAANSGTLPAFKSIYQFGDSLSDTGNLLRWGTMFYPADKLPYGETYFHKATGRFSNGRLIVDYIATAAKLPFLDAYLDKKGSFDHGVNFAVAGATANEREFFDKQNISYGEFKPAILEQLEWFEEFINSTCRAKCAEKFGKSLFIFGEYGGNDYFPAFEQGKSIAEVKTYVPHTVASIIHGVKRVIHHGAKRVLVPGPFPFGCLPSLLTSAATDDAAAYDQFGCLKQYNAFIAYHNSFLSDAVSKLNRQYSGKGVVIVYGDFYGGFMNILHNARKLGFKSLVKACCGGGGTYNFNKNKSCGREGATVCTNPKAAVHWDGVHLTDAAHHYISQFVIDQVSSKLALASI